MAAGEMAADRHAGFKPRSSLSKPCLHLCKVSQFKSQDAAAIKGLHKRQTNLVLVVAHQITNNHDNFPPPCSSGSKPSKPAPPPPPSSAFSLSFRACENTQGAWFHMGHNMFTSDCWIPQEPGNV